MPQTPYTLRIALTLLFFTTALCAEQTLTPVPGKPAAPEFNLIGMDGEMHSLKSYLGKPVIINFWATWCPPCRAELPSLNRAWEKIKHDGIDMLAINVGENAQRISSFIKNFPIDFEVLLDQSGDSVNRWPIDGLPTTFVIDPDGRLVYRAIGQHEWDADQLLDRIRSLRTSVPGH